MWQIYAYFICGGIIGSTTHYLKKYYFDCETVEPLWRWFSSSNFKATLKVYATFIAATITALQAGIITDSMPIITILYVGYLTGYGSDTLNSDEARAKQELVDQAFKAGIIDDRRKDTDG